MNVVKFGFPVRAFAKKHNFGVGSFNLKDGSSVKILSNPESQLFHVWQMKNGSLLKASGGRGENALAASIGEYESKAINSNDITTAIGDSFSLIRK